MTRAQRIAEAERIGAARADELAWIDKLFADIPRVDFYHLIGREFRRGLRERPTTIPGMFRPPSTPTIVAGAPR